MTTAASNKPTRAGHNLLLVIIVLLILVGVDVTLASPYKMPPSQTANPYPWSDPTLMSFPVPVNSILLDAQATSGQPDFYNFASWQSGLDYPETVAFYQGLVNPRWSNQTQVTAAANTTDFSLLDESGALSSATVEISQTVPVQIQVFFLSRGLSG
jgi:hypothetical protein